MKDQVDIRKADHLRAIAEDPAIERAGAGFDAIRLAHRALPELDLDAIDTSVQFLGKRLRLPLLISSMTGGSGEDILEINRNLAQAAEACGVAMAVGSQRVMYTNSQACQSFELRSFAPSVPLVSNLGAVQLNTGFGMKEVREAIDVLQADGIYLHLNPLQEAIQPEGDRNFAGLAARIADVAASTDTPVLLKEVGAGLGPEDVALGLTAGIRHFDLAGRGGTSWSRIEYHRRTEAEDDLGLMFQDWGRTTVEALRDVVPLVADRRDQVTLIASGGVRSGIDMAKAIVLGADLCGVAAPFLQAAQDSTEAVIRQIERIGREFRTAMFLLGCGECRALRGNMGLLL
ncbi:MAG: type 2 isopentenyl-diphosphate Delta-isomerase [Pseudomonadota bacterium]